MSGEDLPGTAVALNIPEGMQAGAFADAAVVWHGEHQFTIDFIAQASPMSTAGPDGSPRIPATVVARVRLPIGVIFQVARAISENVAKYEEQFGKIGPGGPDHPPEEAA